MQLICILIELTNKTKQKKNNKKQKNEVMELCGRTGHTFSLPQANTVLHGLRVFTWGNLLERLLEVWVTDHGPWRVAVTLQPPVLGVELPGVEPG